MPSRPLKVRARDVQELATRKLTLIKTWVDDRGGAVKKLPPELSPPSSTRRTRTICV